MLGKIFKTKHCGELIVSEYRNRDNVTVVFLATGHTITTSKRRLTTKERPYLRDPTYPSVFGVGCIGVGTHKAHHKGADTPVYSVWRAMLRRCYYRGSKHHQRSYEGVTVCAAWLNFQTFADWYAAHHPADGRAYQLDKDTIDPDAMCYGPETCSFVTQQSNLAARTFGRRR